MDESRPIRIREDLSSLPLPPEELWVRSERRGRLTPRLAMAAVLALLVLAISLPLADQLRQRRDLPGGSVGTASAAPAQTSVAPSASASPVPFTPGTTSVGGKLVRNLGPTLVIDTAQYGEITVDLSRVIDVWRETSVDASALRPGDELWIDGAAGTPFVARVIYANIGRIDGIVRAIDQTGMMVEVQAQTGGSTLRRIDFSSYITYGAPAQALSRADLVVGTQIGAVLYNAPGQTPRATRVWW